MEGQAPKPGTFSSSLNNPTNSPSATTQAKSSGKFLKETYRQLLKKKMV